jgi:ATP-dependent DNA helicase RecG
LADVNLFEENGLELIEIKVTPYHNPISYKGAYHYRRGSTKQELKGAALDRFLLQKHGRTWDSVPDPRIGDDNLDPRAIDLFRNKAAQSGRVEAYSLNVTDSELIDKLKLRHTHYLKREAGLLFHPHL